MGDDGLWGQWRRGAHAIRSLAHVAVAAESTHGRSRPARMALLAGSLAADVWIARHTRTRGRRSPVAAIIDTVDVFAWSWLTRHDPVHLQALTFATLAPTVMERAFRLRAGTTAVPLIEPAVAWPSLREPAPEGVEGRFRTGFAARHLAGYLGALALDASPMLAAMTLARRRRGLRVGSIPLVWLGVSALGGFTLARVRDRAQANTTRLWRERTRYLIEEARVRSRVQSALVHNVTEVDPKALLTFLERAGSAPAGALLDQIAEAPATTLSREGGDGLTLSATVDRRTITPHSFATRWVARPQVRMIRDAMAAIDQRLEPLGESAPGDEQVTILAAQPDRLVLRYRGERIDAEQPTPDLAIRLEPTLWPVVASWVLTMTASLSSNVRGSRWALAVSGAAHLLAFTRLIRTPPMERRADRVTAALLVTSALAVDISIGRRGAFEIADPHTGERLEENAGTSATQGVMMLLGTSWHDLRSEAPFIFAIALAGWIYSLRPTHGRSLHSTISEAAFLFMPLLANLGTGEHTHREARLLDEVLQAHLTATISTTARDEARDEIDRFVAQLDCVIDELPRRHPSLSEDEVARIVATYTAERDRIRSTDPLELIGW